MPKALKEAHLKNDEIVENLIFDGVTLKNDDKFKKLYDLYIKLKDSDKINYAQFCRRNLSTNR